MKKGSRTPRPYRQSARALAAEDTGRRILEAVLRRIREQWFQEITLESVATDAGVTVQTVIRRFGSREQLLVAAAEHLSQASFDRPKVLSGNVSQYIDALTADYESSGDFVWRLLAQEERHPELSAFLDHGRRGHRSWLDTIFRPWLENLEARAASARLDALVAATDLFLWKLVRRDMGRSVPAYKRLVSTLLDGVIPPQERP